MYCRSRSCVLNFVTMFVLALTGCTVGRQSALVKDDSSRYCSPQPLCSCNANDGIKTDCIWSEDGILRRRVNWDGPRPLTLEEWDDQGFLCLKMQGVNSIVYDARSINQSEAIRVVRDFHLLLEGVYLKGNTMITDSFLDALADVPKLRILNMIDTPNISSKAVCDFKTIRPEVVVIK